MSLHILIILGLLISGIIITSNNKQSKKRFYLFVVFIVLLVLSAFRSINIGNDTEEYVLMFKKFGQTNNIFGLDTSMEIGYVLLNKVLYSISSNPLILIGITSAFVLGVIIIFIYKNSNMVWLSVFLFINFRLYYFTLSGIRQSMALAFILISYRFLKKRRPVLFILIVLLASSFHVSAILFLIVYPLSKINFNRAILLQYIFIGGILFFVFNSFISIVFRFFPKYKVYLTSSYFEEVKLASIIEFFIILIVFLIGLIVCSKNLNKDESKSEFTTTKFYEDKNLLFHIISIAVIINFISINASVIQRAALYFYIFIIIFIPNLIINGITDRKARVLVLYFIIILTFMYNIVLLIFRPEWQHVYPFEFFWQVE